MSGESGLPLASGWYDELDTGAAVYFRRKQMGATRACADLLYGFDGESQTDRFGDGNQCRQARIAMHR